MKYEIVQTENIARLHEASTALMERHVGMPGMGVVHGDTGYGKSTACAWLNNRVHGIYVRARALSTPSSFLGSILKEIDVEPARSCAGMVDQLVERLALSGRPLMIDEADYVAETARLTETLRDIHDLSTVPVILIGMAGITRKLDRRRQLSGRLAQSVEFTGMDLEDARLVADTLCEIRVAEDLLADLRDKAAGEIRRVVVGLTRIEQRARQLNTDTLDLRAWGKANYFEGRIASAPAKASTGRVTSIR
ncbi:ATP-binding protein [Salinisphaera hydrothermalis]|uniref:ATP-binding protein n=1 Tax=Salinisphaera hydrothermalis TaxID=563188 RepID=UPI003340D782